MSSINNVVPDFGTNNIRNPKWLGTFGTKLKSTQSICNAFSISSDDLQNEITCRIGTNGMIYVGRITLFLNGCIGTNIVKFEDSSAGPCLADNTFSNNRSGNFIELLPLRILHEKGSIYEKLIEGELKKKNDEMYVNAEKMIKEIGERLYSVISTDENNPTYKDKKVKDIVISYLDKTDTEKKICNVIYKIQQYINQQIKDANYSEYKQFYIELSQDNINKLYTSIFL